MRRVVRVVATLVITGLAVAYLLWKIDVSKTVHIVTHARFGWFALALAIMAGTVWPMAWRWRQLLRARGIDDQFQTRGEGRNRELAKKEKEQNPARRFHVRSLELKV